MIKTSFRHPSLFPVAQSCHSKNIIMENSKNLVVFDFDHSLIDIDSDNFVVESLDKDLSNNMDELSKTMQWTNMMNHLFQKLHEKNVNKDAILSAFSKVPMHVKMIEALKHAKNHGNCDIVILSDANSVSISQCLKANNVESLFSRIITNPATFDINGRFTVSRFHSLDNPHNCTLETCAINLCKGKELINLFNSDRYDCVVYVGDGRNDFCPSLRLGSKDHVFVRRFKGLERLVASLEKDVATADENRKEIISIKSKTSDHRDSSFVNNDRNQIRMKASIHLWNEAEDILKLFRSLWPIEGSY